MSFSKYDERGAYHWEALANRFPTAYSARLHAQYGWFVDQAKQQAPKLIVDVGCGDAALTHLLAEATGARVVGIEPEPRGIELARDALAKHGSRAEALEGRGESLPFEDREADLVVLSEVVEHVPSPEPLVEEAARVLANHGSLLISTPQWQKPELRPHHVHEFKAGELRDLCSRYFQRADVYVAEPPRLYAGYMSAAPARTAVNLLALAGANPFRKRKPAEPGRERWHQLYAVASRPHESPS